VVIMTTTTQRYSSVAILLHWLIAAAMIFMIILGWRMGDQARGPSTFAIFQLHKSLGISILLLSLLRILWRLAKPPLAYSQPLGRWESRLSHLVHVGFYAAMFVLPLSGWLLVSTSKIQVPTLLFGTIPWPDLPGFSGMTDVIRHGWHERGEAVHGLMAKLLTYGLIPLHLAGVVKHQLMSKDDIAGRMIPGVKPGAVLSPLFWAPFLGLAVVVAAAYSIFPPSAAEAAGNKEHSRTDAAPKPMPVASSTASRSDGPPPSVAAAPLADAKEAVADPATGAADKDTPPPAAGPVSAWKVNSGGHLGFRTEWSGTAIEGSFSKWTADIRFSPDDLKGSRVKVEIDTASVASGDSQRDGSLVSEDWFNSSRTPLAVFSASKFRQIGEDRFEAMGQLSLRGVTRPVILPFTLKIKGDTAHMSGVTSLDRTQYGVGQGEWSATDQIPAKVNISVDLTATRKP
jgi:cytochrome b561/polyisoprenoid-binding protein YceI